MFQRQWLGTAYPSFLSCRQTVTRAWFVAAQRTARYTANRAGQAGVRPPSQVHFEQAVAQSMAAAGATVLSTHEENSATEVAQSVLSHSSLPSPQTESEVAQFCRMNRCIGILAEDPAFFVLDVPQYFPISSNHGPLGEGRNLLESTTWAAYSPAISSQLLKLPGKDSLPLVWVVTGQGGAVDLSGFIDFIVPPSPKAHHQTRILDAFRRRVTLTP